MLIAEISNGAFIGFMALFSLLAWFFGWLIGRMQEPAESRSLRQSIIDRDRALEKSGHEVDRYKTQLVDARKVITARENDVRDLKADRTGLMTQVDEHHSSYTELEREHDALQSQVAALAPFESKFQKSEADRAEVAKRHEDAQAGLETLRRKCAALTEDVTTRDERIAALAPFEKDYAESQQRCAQLSGKVETKQAEISDLRKRLATVAPFEAKFQNAEERCRQLAGENAELERRVGELSPWQPKYEESEQQRARLFETVEARDVKIAALKQQIDILSPFQSKHRESEQARAAAQRRHDEAMRGKNQELDRLRDQVAKLSPLPEQLRERDGRIERLEAVEREHRECADAIARLRAARPPAPKPAAAIMREAVQRPLQRDDLKKIWGIGKVFERQLNDMGYYRYRDIAVWSNNDVEKVAESIGSFPDRIHRDRWIAQAQDLANGA